MLLTETYYRQITGDTTTAASAVTAAASAAQDLLEDDLGRAGFLEEASRTERCRVYPDGTLYPTATPVSSVTGGLVVADDTVYGATPDATAFAGVFLSDEPQSATITYTGGYTTATCPESILQDLAWAAYVLAHPSGSVPLASTVGATAVRLGDAQVTYGSGGAGGSVVSRTIAWSPSTMRYRRRSP